VHVRVVRRDVVEHVAELRAEGWTLAAIARAAGLAPSTVSLASRSQPVWWSTMRALARVGT
jgi:lambda repressor-like predicted transcriptional regulator